MKIAVISDIHGNLEALQAVSTDLNQQGAEKVICLGDMIGYGPDPDEVVTLIRDNGFLAVLGNHEFALGDIRGRRWLNFQAAENNEVSSKMLSIDNLNYCIGLPLYLQFAGGYFVHAYPPDSVFRYLHRQSDEKISKLFLKKISKLYFVGHTHRLKLVTESAQGVTREVLAEGQTQLDPRNNYIINCGSVGQPRDPDRRARYLIWNTQDHVVEVRCVEYDNLKTIQKIRDIGFPEAYALRLQ